MDKHTINQLIEVSALEAEVQGMVADNTQREIEGLSMAYTSADFFEVADQMRKVATKHDNESMYVLLEMILSDESASKFNDVAEYREHLKKFIKYCDFAKEAIAISEDGQKHA